MAKAPIEQRDLHHLDDVSSAVLLATPWKSRILIWMVLAFVAIFIIWASQASLEVVTRGSGKVVPSTHLQVVQNLEGGIVREIYIKEGQVVSAGEPLLRIDDTSAGSDLRERVSTLDGLQATIMQYDTELESIEVNASADAWKDQVIVKNIELPFDEEFKARSPALVSRAMTAYRTHLNQLNSGLNGAREQILQKEQELRELRSRINSLERSYQLSRRELGMTAPLVREGVVSQVDLLKIQREVNDLRGDLESARLAVPGKQSELDEAISNRVGVAQEFRSRAAEELAKTQADLGRLREGRTSLQDRLDRTLVTSPVQGAIKTLNINTIGGVIEPGEDLMEIVPIEDQLLVQARVAPKDIGFLRIGQPAVVKLSAYDFTIYGGLEGKVDQISADTVQDEEGNSFYEIKVLTEQNHLGSDSDPLTIIPGMQASVDVITGNQTVLQYLMKPILRARQGALRER
ncbi:HlyD family type I secretion periplasmic adaptor subunit [bacterium Scap17]|nr:HlyD family type I secretion periplasmic adaptor subunit [bacterium Scap17]